MQARYPPFQFFLFHSGALHCAHPFASEQRLRIKAKMLEPDALIGEVDTMAELGEEVGEALLPEYVERLFCDGAKPARPRGSHKTHGQPAHKSWESGWHASATMAGPTIWLAGFGITSPDCRHRESRELALLLSELKRRSHYVAPLGRHGERSAKCPQIGLRKQFLHVSSEMAV